MGGQGFRSFMKEQFECGEDVFPQVDAVFHAFDLDAQGRAELREGGRDELPRSAFCPTWNADWQVSFELVWTI